MRSRRAPTLLIVLIVSLQALVAGAQTKPARSEAVVLPQGLVTYIPSPDRKWMLTFECPGYSGPRRLWIEQSAVHKRRAVREFERSASISWSPDSRSFFVTDDWGSNGSASYVYDAVTLKVTDLANVVVAKDARAREYLRAGHSYLQAKRWINSHELLVRLFGHFYEPPPRGFRGSFTLQYRVDLKGTVEKISERSAEDPGN